MGLVFLIVALYPILVLFSPVISLVSGLVNSGFDASILFSMIFS